MCRQVPAGRPQARCMLNSAAGFEALVRANATAMAIEGRKGQRKKRVDGVDRESCGNASIVMQSSNYIYL